MDTNQDLNQDPNSNLHSDTASVTENPMISEEQSAPEENSSCCSTPNHCIRNTAFVFSLLSFIGVAVLLAMRFCCSGSCDTPVASVPKTIQTGELKIAYVDTDSLLLQYEYAKELEQNLKTYQTTLEKSYQSQVQKLHADYESYLKNGEKLTLTDQKKKEEELAQRQQQLPQLSQQMMAQLQERQAADNKKLLDAVYAYIRDYNAKHDRYHIILSRAYTNSAMLYIEDGMNITPEIIAGLNEEYKQVKGK